MLVLHHNPVLRLLLPDGADFEAVLLLLGSDSAGVDGIYQEMCIRDRSKQILAFCTTPKSKKELAVFCGFKDLKMCIRDR